MSTRPFARFGAIAAIALVVACSSSTDPEPDPDAPQPSLEALPRALTAGEQRVIGAANEFSFALFRRLSEARADSNVFTSPLSASMALGFVVMMASSSTARVLRSGGRAGLLSRSVRF
jgi:hypothetical protein